MAPISLSPLWATKPPKQIPFFFFKKKFCFIVRFLGHFCTYRFHILSLTEIIWT